MKRLWTIMAMFAVITLLISACKKDEEEEEETPQNTAPTASFTVEPATGYTNTVFQLDASASSDAETPSAELQVRWDANNDGEWDIDYSTTKTASFTYDTEGSYTIKLEVKDEGGLTSTATNDITVEAGSGNNPPDMPSDPVPANNATDVAVDITLQWTCSDPDQDPLTYDVYFGTEQNPVMVASDITANTYNPGPLAYETSYYWYIIVKDNQGGTNESIIWSFTTAQEVFVCGNDFTDDRNGKTYGSVLIGEQCWMADNLNIGTRIDGADDMSDDGEIEKYCYDDEEANCDTYGGLYQWNEMMQYSGDNIQGICPEGWHLPSLEEWQVMEMELGMPEDEALASSGWQGTYEGNALKEGGSSGYNALMTGRRTNSGTFMAKDYMTDFFTATTQTSSNAWARTLDTGHGSILHGNYIKDYGFPVRCILD